MTVRASKGFAHAMAIGVVIGSVVAGSVMAGSIGATPIVHAALSPVALSSVAGPLAGSGYAIIVGGTTEPTPSVTFAQTVEDLYLRPLGFDTGALDSAVCDLSAAGPCDAPLQVLTTPALAQQGHGSFVAAAEIARAVHNQLDTNPDAFDAEHPLTVFGYSQGATAGSIAMTQLAHDGVPADLLHFVFIGDPATPDGVWPNLAADLDAMLGPAAADAIQFLDYFFDMGPVLGIETPNDLYPTTVYTIDGDAVGDFQNVFEDHGIAGVFAGLLIQHFEYLGLTPAQIADATMAVDGAVTHIGISDDIDHLNAWVNALGHGLLDSGLLPSITGSIEAFFYSLFGSIQDFFGDWTGVEDTLTAWF